jgi:hypothetical protein
MRRIYLQDAYDDHTAYFDMEDVGSPYHTGRICSFDFTRGTGSWEESTSDIVGFSAVGKRGPYQKTALEDEDVFDSDSECWPVPFFLRLIHF